MKIFGMEGVKMNKTVIFCIFLAAAGTMTALDIDGKAPVFSGTGGPSDSIASALTAETGRAFDDALDELRSQVGGIKSKPEKLIQAWGNSAIFASHGATQRAVGEYKLFAVTVGPMVGLQLPASPFAIADELDNVAAKLNDEQDLRLGLNPQLFGGQVGINTSEFLLKDLYLGLRFGYTKFDNMIEGLSFSNLSLGLTANYQLLPHKDLSNGLLIWRGVNLGTGLLYQGTTIGFAIALDSIEQNIGAVAGLNNNLTLAVDPTLALDMKVNTVTIPLEASTSVRLLWFLNVALGLGVDMGFGKSDMKVGMNGDINVKGFDGAAMGVQQSESGNVSVSAGGVMAPGFFNLKLMTGLGFSMGPVILDIPITFYVLNNGFNVGVTLGVVW
jgi:hypothetical protein